MGFRGFRGVGVSGLGVWGLGFRVKGLGCKHSQTGATKPMQLTAPISQGNKKVKVSDHYSLVGYWGATLRPKSPKP